MRSRRPWTLCRAFWMLLAVVLLVPALALAQTETGRISGTAMDEQGGVLPGATITATNVGTGVSRSAVTDSNGRFVFTNLQPGTYEVAAELAGFAKNSGKVIVPVGGAMEFNPKLGLAGTSETIQVVSETPTVNVLNAEQATTVSESQIRELPTLTRNVYDLVGVSGNVSRDLASDRGTGYSINGARSASTNILLDGSANNNEFDATVGQEVPLDSVQEFSVITNNFSAQYGRATGGIVNVATKSGTNKFRGTGYEFFRNEKLTANSYDNTSNDIEKGKYRRDQTGFSIGGPVVKDKLHFFSSLEYIRVRSADTEISWVPTPQFLSASAPATQAFFNAYGGSQHQRSDADPRRGDGDRGRRCRRVQQSAGGPPGVRTRREEPADRRRRRRPAGQLSVGEPSRLQHGPEHAAVRAVCVPEPGSRAGHERLQPVRRVRHGVSEQEPQLPRLGHACLLAHVHGAEQGGLEPPDGRSAAERRPAADALHEPDDAGAAYRGTGSHSPATCPGAREAPFRLAARSSCCSCIRTRPGSRASTISGSAAPTCTSRTSGRSAPTRTPSRR